MLYSHCSGETFVELFQEKYLLQFERNQVESRKVVNEDKENSKRVVFVKLEFC